MCPACITSTAVMVAGAGSTGGILAVCIAQFRRQFRKFFSADRLGLLHKTKEN
jgi:malic enzyme